MTMHYVRSPIQIIERSKRSFCKITELRYIIYQVCIWIAPGEKLIIIYKIIDNTIFLILHDSYIILFSIGAEIHIERAPVFHLFLILLRNTLISWQNHLNIQV